MWNPIKREVVRLFNQMIEHDRSAIPMLKKIFVHVIFTLSLEKQISNSDHSELDHEYVLAQIEFFLLWVEKSPETFPYVTAYFFNNLLQTVVMKMNRSRTYNLSNVYDLEFIG